MATLFSGPMSWQPTVKQPTREEAFLQSVSQANGFQVTGTSYGMQAPSRPRRQPKNHIEENVRRMRQIQRESKQKSREDEAVGPTPVKALWKSEKYADVPSKLAAELQKPDLVPAKMYSSMTLHHNINERPLPRPHSANYLRAHSRTGIPPQTPRRPQTSSTSQPHRGGPSLVERLPLERAGSCGSLHLLRSNADFIKINGIAAVRAPLRRSPSATSLQQSIQQKDDAHVEWKKKTMGCVPKYLQKRKEEREQEEYEKIRSMPDPDQPAGHRLMPREEHLQTLELLKKSHKGLHSKLAALPIRSDTLRLQKVKEELDARLAEVEEAIKVFSRPKVFVRVD